MTMIHDTTATARPLRAIHILANGLTTLIRGLALRAERKAQMRALADLNDHLLRDIGVSRGAADKQIRRYGGRRRPTFYASGRGRAAEMP